MPLLSRPHPSLALRAVLLALPLLLGAAVTAPADALQIFYEVELDDHDSFPPPIPGEEPEPEQPEFWNYTYTVIGSELLEGQGFSILFHPDDAEFIFAGGGSSDFDVIEIQPDALLPDWGALDALALHDDPDLSVVFFATVSWIGAEPPGAQDFVVYDTDFSVIDGGVTQPIPEPGSALLLGLGLAGLAVSGHRRTLG